MFINASSRFQTIARLARQARLGRSEKQYENRSKKKGISGPMLKLPGCAQS
jgi:hypothetical protein